MYLLKPNSDWQVHQPSYNKGRTVFRPWADVARDDTGAIVETPARNSEGNFGMSFFVRELVCLGWGVDARITCFAPVADESNWPQGSPLQLFYDDINMKKKEYRHLFDREGGFSPLSAPRAMGFIKGLLIENRGKRYNDNPRWGTFLMMPKSLSEAFEALILQAGDGSGDTANDPFGWNAKFSAGDPVGLVDGKVYEMHKESEILGKKADVVDLSGTGRAQSGRDKSDIESYACRIWDTSPKLPLPAEKVAKWDTKFEDAFWYLTGQEQIEMCLLPAFGRSCREAVMYTFGNRGVLPASYVSAKVAVDMGASSTQPAETPPASDVPVVDDASVPATDTPRQPQAGGGVVNLDGDNSSPESQGTSAAAPAVDTTTASAGAVDSNTAEAIRDRLKTMRGE